MRNFRKGLVWWRDLGSIFSNREGNTEWFSSNIARKIGNGENTYFWHDVWINNVPLSVKFSRLYTV